MPAAAMISDPTARMKHRAKIYGLRTFLDPGCPMDFDGAFRDNVRQFLRECGDVEDRATARMPTWCTHLVDEKTGVVAPLYTVEECVSHSAKPFCDYCRCTGWSHHLVSKRRYHFIIPGDNEWDKPLDSNAFYLRTHLLHGLIHCNGFGHLIWINGRDGGSSYIPGRDLMDLWDRICTSLGAREVTVEDVSRKRALDLRLLLGVAHGTTWFGRWGYGFCMGSFGVTHDAYRLAIYHLATLDLDALIAESAKFGWDRGELRRIVAAYRKLRRSEPDSAPPIVTARDLLRYMLELKRRAPPPPKHRPLPAPPPPPKKGPNDKRRRCQDFSLVAAELSSRWPVRRLEVAAQVIVDALKEHGTMTRQEVRDAARLVIGDTGLLDFVLKSLGNSIVGGYVVRRAPHPSTRVLEFSLVEGIDGDPNNYTEEQESSPAYEAAAQPNASQLERDLACLYRSLLVGQPESVRVVLDSKHWVKKWGLRDDEDDRLRFLCIWMPNEEEMEERTRALPPPVVVVVEPYASVGELRGEVERAMRDTYCVLDGFTAAEVEGLEGEDWEPVFGCGLESAAVVWVRGVGADVGCGLVHEGGADTWAVGCGCGARDDDGERMVACDVCEVWHHTRCIGIADGEPVPPLFLCSNCGSSIIDDETAMMVV